MEAVNRKLIRPSLNEIKEQIAPPRRAAQPPQKKPVPPDQTNAENFYYVKQMQAKTPMVFVLRDGEQEGYPGADLGSLWLISA